MQTSEPAQQIPYSTLAAIDLSPTFSLRSVDGQVLQTPGPDEIILTDWAAEQMHAQVGDTIAVTYFEPETTHGASVESRRTFRVSAITPLTPPAEPYLPDQKLEFAQRPTMANDPHLTPEVRGITDQKSIDDWEVPFTIDYERIRPADDEYWEDYGTTPKAFISLAAGVRSVGQSFRPCHVVSHPGDDHERPRRRSNSNCWPVFVSDTARLGFEFQPIKRQQLQASAGNTPFDVLFLLLSFFVIAAALLLVALLFRLGFEQRARQAGVLQAVGWRASRVRRLLVVEGLGVAVAGSLLGLALGLGYAALLLAALRSKSWWLGAVGTPFLTFHVTARSLWIGGTAGSLVSTLVIAWSVYLTRHTSARQLLAGQTSSIGRPVAIRSRVKLAADCGGPVAAACDRARVCGAGLVGPATGGRFCRRRSGDAHVAAVGAVACLAHGWGFAGAGDRSTGAVAAGDPQRSAQSRPQRADDWLDRDRQLPDCGDERVSTAAD